MVWFWPGRFDRVGSDLRCGRGKAATISSQSNRGKDLTFLLASIESALCRTSSFFSGPDFSEQSKDLSRLLLFSASKALVGLLSLPLSPGFPSLWTSPVSGKAFKPPLAWLKESLISVMTKLVFRPLILALPPSLDWDENNNAWRDGYYDLVRA